MGYSEEQIVKALKMLDDLKSIKKVMNILGYPKSRESFYNWLKRRDEYFSAVNTPSSTKEFKPRVRCVDKQAIIHCFEQGGSIQSVSKELSYSTSTIMKWCKILQQEGTLTTMPENKNTKSKKVNGIAPSQKEIDAMKAQMFEMQLEIDVLKEVLNILKKDPGIDLKSLTNSEKVVLIDALRTKYSLPILLIKVRLSKSSYYYQKQIQKLNDKYEKLVIRIKELFHENKQAYGYRRIHSALKDEGKIVSEKVIRRLMKKEHLIVYKKNKKKYSSYEGEITPAVSNVIKRDFHSDAPNKKWLTDITEFKIPEGKVYLSPIIDCFDGLPVSWTIGTSPDANLVNTMLDNAIELLGENEKPIIHSDRGCHYRWPGWIERMEHAHLTRSMSKKGCSPDNSACEGFFGRLKNEMFYGRSWMGVSITNFIDELNSYINWYREKRIKMSLGGMSPLDYRRSLGMLN